MTDQHQKSRRLRACLFYRYARRPRTRRRVAIRICQGLLIHVAVAVVRSGFDQLLSATPWA